MKTPVAYIVFNRPDLTSRTFAAIREQKPSQLFVIADGPREEHPTDSERCAEVRDIVAQVDWPCEVSRQYSAVNLGCKVRPSSGLDWVFGLVDRAIILEDDCLPGPEFFEFCDILLERYADDDRVWVITGNNFQRGRRRGGASYYFSRYNSVWGWATWRRAWNRYRADIPFWPEWRESVDWRRTVPDRIERRYWTGIFDRVQAGHVESAWDYPWSATVWYHGGLTATPNANLVTNIGFGIDATHTRVGADRMSVPLGRLGLITHPARIEQDRHADRFIFDHQFKGLRHRWHRRLLRSSRGLVRRLIAAFKRRGSL